MTPLLLCLALCGQTPTDSDRQLLRRIALEERIGTLDHRSRQRERWQAWNDASAAPRVVFVQSPGMPQAPSAPQPAPIINIYIMTAPAAYPMPQQPSYGQLPAVPGMPPPMYYATYAPMLRSFGW